MACLFAFVLAAFASPATETVESLPDETGAIAKAVLVADTLTFRYDDVDYSSEGSVYPFAGGGVATWGAAADRTLTVVFDENFTASVQPTTCRDWFSGFARLVSISGLTALDTSRVTDMSGMFRGCSALETIYVKDSFSTVSVSESADMFLGCTKLVGGNKTAYDASHVDADYARADAPGAPGYFTRVSTAFGKLALIGDTTRNPLLYAVGESVTFTVTLVDEQNNLAPVAGQTLRWTRCGDDGKTETGTVSSDSPLIYTTSSAKPGFIRFTVRVLDANGKEMSTPVWDGGAGVDVNNIESRTLPADFNSFWDGAVAALEAVPPAATVTELAMPTGCEKYADTVFYAKFSIPVPGADPAWPAQGLIAYPKDAAANSLAVSLQYSGYGYGGTALTDGDFQAVRRGLIVLQTTRQGESPDGDAAYYDWVRKQVPNFCMNHNDPVTDSDYYKMLMRNYRAFQWARTLPCANGKGAAIGGSMGGYQALGIAALSTDVTGVTAYIPWSSDLCGAGAFGRMPSTLAPSWTETLDYVSMSHLATRITAPVTLSFGLGDYICPPSGQILLFNALRGSKMATVTQNSDHGGAHGPNCGTYIFRDAILGESLRQVEVNPYLAAGVTNLVYSLGEDERVYVFRQDGSFLAPSNMVSAQMIVVGGGGAGGGNYGAGGGAGQFVATNDVPFVANAAYAVRIGPGGTTGAKTGNDGGTTSIVGDGVAIEAIGGGGGGGNWDGAPGRDGGSGGGAGGSANGTAPGRATAPGGHDGGSNAKEGYGCGTGGGGGAGGAGADGTAGSGGDGGAGVVSTITGYALTYAYGGGGVTFYNTATKYGRGGARNGAGDGYRSEDVPATAGEYASGGGGGGGKPNGGGADSAGAGGSGVVVIRVKLGLTEPVEPPEEPEEEPEDPRQPEDPELMLPSVPDDFGTTNQVYRVTANELVYAFYKTGESTFTVPDDCVGPVRILVVGGGGGGGGRYGSGGGGGSVTFVSAADLAVGGTYTVVVGAGGASSTGNGADGQDSLVTGPSGFAVVAKGGGHGSGGWNKNYAGGSSAYAGGAGSAECGGGGGGAGGVGGDGAARGANCGGTGGRAVTNDVAGVSRGYGYGGGGAGHWYTARSGTYGYGGALDGWGDSYGIGQYDTPGFDARPGQSGTGGGGGAGAKDGQSGAPGGSGCVIIRFAVGSGEEASDGDLVAPVFRSDGGSVCGIVSGADGEKAFRIAIDNPVVGAAYTVFTATELVGPYVAEGDSTVYASGDLVLTFAVEDAVLRKFAKVVVSAKPHRAGDSLE